MKHKHDIPEALIELMQRAQDRSEERIHILRLLEAHLADQGHKLLRYAKYSKGAIVLVGAILATRVVADNIYQSAHKGSVPSVTIALVYTILSVLIAIIGGMDSTFRFAERASEVNFLHVRCTTVIHEVEESWAKNVERLGASLEALESTDPLLEKLSKQITEVETRLAQLSVRMQDLAKEHVSTEGIDDGTRAMARRASAGG